MRNINPGFFLLGVLMAAGCADGAPLVAGDQESPATGSATSERPVDGKVLLLKGGISAGEAVLSHVEDGTGTVELSVAEGGASFGSGLKVERVQVSADGAVVLPAIQVAEGSDALLSVSRSNKEIARVRVRGITVDRWQRLVDFLSAHPEMLIEQGTDYAAVDESAVASDQGIKIDLGEPGMAATRSSDKAICARVPWGPGEVDWASSNPSGQGFSVKPETQWPLIWAAAPNQDIDGIYRRAWGCNYALKVADSCTASVDTAGNVTCCCNAAMEAAGHTCTWINPAASQHSWPQCPL